MYRATIEAIANRPIGFLSLLLFVFVLLDRGVAFGLDSLVERSKHRLSRIYNHDQVSTAPIVVLGHSRGVGLLDPDRAKTSTGSTVLNLAVNGMSTELAEAIFLDYLDKHPQPAALFIEISSLCSGNALIRDMKPVAFRSERLTAILRSEEPAIFWTSQLFASYRYNGDLLPRIVVHLNRDDQTLINEFRASPDVLDSVTIAPTDWPIKSRNIAALNRLATLAKDRGIPLRLVLGPFWPHFIDGSDLPENIITAAESETGADVWDFSRSIGDSFAFADHVHLNVSGTAQLHSLMAKAGVFNGIDTRPNPDND